MSSKATGFMHGAWILALVLGIGQPLRAQVAGATLSGTITDPQGGAIANAKVASSGTKPIVKSLLLIV